MHTWFAPGFDTLNVDTNQESVDLGRYVKGGRLQLRIVIQNGILVGGDQSTRDALYTSTAITRPTECSVTILNNGTIQASNGSGGAGGDRAIGSAGDGGAGTAGGDAINIPCPLTIDNTNGYILAGGGGGGGGGGDGIGPSLGRGGGGAGYPGGSGGSGGGTAPAGDTVQYGFGSGGPADGGSSGAGGNCNGIAMVGGNGGGGDGTSGGAGGAAGKAVDANGNTVTWIAGFNPTQVKGAVV